MVRLSHSLRVHFPSNVLLQFPLHGHLSRRDMLEAEYFFSEQLGNIPDPLDRAKLSLLEKKMELDPYPAALVKIWRNL